MRLLLDTHALLWWLDGDRRLSLKARRAIASESDPFDRMLIAQSQIEDVALVSDDEAFDAFDVRRFW